MKIFRYIILLALAVFIIAARLNVNIGEWYAVTVYPIVSTVLSFSVSWIPFSMEEVLVVAAAILIIATAVKGIRQRKAKAILSILEIIAWVTIGFYLGWGMNYFRKSIYSRGGIERQQYDEHTFRNFLKDYTDSLNNAYTVLPETMEYSDFDYEIKEKFSEIPKEYGLSLPQRWNKPKGLLFNRLYSSVGVAGYIGPFFCEIQINEDVLPAQKPFSYAHELSHLLGVSNEDEANFWAYRTCRSSEIQSVRYSGYFSLLPYVLSNASRVLEPEEYKAYQRSIRPEILQQLIDQQNYWKSKYNKTLGKVQSRIYDAMLKSNKISSGTRNYMQVIDLIIATEY